MGYLVRKVDREARKPQITQEMINKLMKEKREKLSTKKEERTTED